MAKHIVITGSTRGIGLGLAEALIKRGHNVVVSGRSQAAVDEAAKRIGARGFACDVTKIDQVQALWNFAKPTNIWINNAGAGNKMVALREQALEDIVSVGDINLRGTLIGTKVALDGMMQQGGGVILNVEGFGSDGRMMRTGMATYGATKTGIRYFTRSVAKELEGQPVKIGTIIPGVVVTEALLGQFEGVPKATWEAQRGFYEAVADPVDVAAAEIADGVLAFETNGGSVSRFSLPGMLWNMMSPSRKKRGVLKALPEPKTI